MHIWEQDQNYVMRRELAKLNEEKTKEIAKIQEDLSNEREKCLLERDKIVRLEKVSLRFRPSQSLKISRAFCLVLGDRRAEPGAQVCQQGKSLGAHQSQRLSASRVREDQTRGPECKKLVPKQQPALARGLELLFDVGFFDRSGLRRPIDIRRRSKTWKTKYSG